MGEIWGVGGQNERNWKNALNDVLRTIILINGKIEEISEIQKQQEILISYLRGMIAGSESE